MKRTLLFLVSFLPTLLIAQHSISGVFSPANDFTYAFLYKATPDGANYIDRAELKEGGSFSIALDSTATTGVYKIVYALPAEENNFDFIYNGKENVEFTFDLEKGLEFTVSDENIFWASYTKSMELVNMTISNFYEQKSTDKKAFNDIFKTLKDTQNAYEKSTNNLLVSELIKANRPYIPENFEDISTYSKNIKNNYFKHVDFSNLLLQSSDFLLERIMTYVFGMSESIDNESYKTLVDELVTYIGDNNTIIKTSLLDVIWNRFLVLENHELLSYINDTYLLDLAKQTNNAFLIDTLTAYKNNAVGTKATDFSIVLNENGKTTTTSLYKLNVAEEYLLIFWSSTCGHCLNELPEVMKLTTTKPNLKVIAYGLEDDKENWQKEIKNLPDFMHVIGLDKWNNTLAKAYNIKATPSYFLLDKDKIIIAKPEQLEDLKEILK